MTEAEWLAADRDSIRRAVSQFGPRRQRLIMCASCRLLGELLIPAATEALDVLEEFADTGKTKAAIRRVRKSITALQLDQCRQFGPSARWLPLRAIEIIATDKVIRYDAEAVVGALVADDGLTRKAARRRLFVPYSDIFGNPFRSVPFSPAWRTDTALSLARTMYDSREFSAMPILGDALQDAGCDNEDVLTHCRGPGTHVRGCWVCDLVLRKE
jgi:hypothetical protein